MKSLKYVASLGLGLSLALSLSGCGDSGSGGGDSSTPAPGAQGNTGKDADGTKKPVKTDRQAEGEAAQIAGGKYYLKSAVVEAFDSQGNKLAPQTLQVAGDYTWIVEPQGGESYQVTMTGNAMLSLNSEVVVEVNCKGAQDVYSWEITRSSALRNVQLLEATCPTSTKMDTATQRQMAPVGKNAFRFTEAENADGVRAIVTYTFMK